jgi:hypothetical protein
MRKYIAVICTILAFASTDAFAKFSSSRSSSSSHSSSFSRSSSSSYVSSKSYSWNTPAPKPITVQPKPVFVKSAAIQPQKAVAITPVFTKSTNQPKTVNKTIIVNKTVVHNNNNHSDYNAGSDIASNMIVAAGAMAIANSVAASDKPDVVVVNAGSNQPAAIGLQRVTAQSAVQKVSFIYDKECKEWNCD